MRSILNKHIFLRLFSLLLIIFTVISLPSCAEKVKEEDKAEFSSITKMYAANGISVILDGNFKKYYPENCSLAAENGDLKFEAFYIEKAYFTENGRNVTTPEGALAFVNPGKDTGAEVQLNFLWDPYVEFVTADPNGTDNDIRMYYLCIEHEDKYWFCTFFSYDKNFEEYRPAINEYLNTIKPYTPEE